MITEVKVPDILDKSLSYLGTCCTALPMIVIGMTLADSNFKKCLDPQIILLSIFRLIVIPAALLGILWLLDIDPYVIGVCVLLTSMPFGATTAMLAVKYDVEPEVASGGVTASTLLSIITTPL